MYRLKGDVGEANKIAIEPKVNRSHISDSATTSPTRSIARDFLMFIPTLLMRGLAFIDSAIFAWPEPELAAKLRNTTAAKET